MVYVLFIVIALVSFAVQRTLQSKFERYSKIPIPYGLTGRDIAMILAYNRHNKRAALEET